MPGLKRALPAEHAKASSKKARPEERKPAPATSTLLPSEVDFPRGGGSTLTPFEHQQVLREVKAETSAARKAKAAIAASEDLFTDADAVKRKRERQKANRDRNNASKKKASVVSTNSRSAVMSDEDRPNRIEVLNYKRVTTGTRLLCSVLAVHPLAVVLSLPNQMLGHIPITNISDTFTARLEAAEDGSDNDDSGENENDSSSSISNKDKTAASDLPELRDMYHVGQWVVASVVSVMPVSNRVERARESGEYEYESRRVELTMEPQTVNDGVTVSDLSAGYLLPMTVKSKEDHGFLMDTGIQGVGAFLSFEDAGDQQPQAGQTVLAAITKVSENGRSVTASLTKAKTSSLSTGPTIAGLVPGNLIRVLVTAVSLSGLNVKLFGLFDATIDALHMSGKEAQVGQHLKARILWDIGPLGAEDPDDKGHLNQRKVALSAADHVVGLDSSSATLNDTFPLGEIVQATVIGTREDWGLTCSFPGTEVKGFTHISACSDSHIASLPSSTGPFRIGTKHEARVVGHSPTDRVVQISFQPSILSRKFMRVSEVMIGESIKSTIKSITPKSVILDINGAVDGVVFPAHFADIPLKKPEKKYKVGQSVRARVWNVDSTRNRVELSLKKTLVQSELAVVSSLQDARVGLVVHGVVSKVLEGNASPSAVLVDLFGRLRAYVPISEATEAGSSSDSIRMSFFAGKCIKLRLTRVDYETGKITASIKQASDSFLKRLNVDAVQLGEIVKGKVAAVHQDVIVMELQPSNVRALLGLNALAKMRETTADQLRTLLGEGEVLGNLKVVDKNTEKGIVILGSTSSRPKSSDSASMQPGSIISARVQGREKNAVLLRIGQNTRGRLHVCDCVDDFGNGNRNSSDILPIEGTDITVCCLNVRGTSSKKADLTMRPSRLRSLEKVDVRDVEVNGVAQLKVGIKARGFIRAIAEKGGLFVELSRNVTARVLIAELFDSYIKDWTSHFVIGQLVEGIITDVQPHQNKVEMSLRKEPGKANKKTSKGSNGQIKSSSLVKLEDLEVGEIVRAFVKSITEYGLFLQIDGSDLSGLAHKSQISDEMSSSDVLRAFSIGDRVKAKLIKVDVEKRKLSFGLKPSLFGEAEIADSEEDDQDGSDVDVAAEEESEEEEDQESATGDSDVEMDTNALLKDDADDEDLLEIDYGETEDDDSEEEDDDESEGAAISDVLHPGSKERSSDDDEQNISQEVLDSRRQVGHVVPALQLSGGFSWAAGAAEDDHHSSSDEESAEDEKREKKRKSKKSKQSQEDLTADLATKTPDSAQDFERLLLGSPNSSFLWIQFMSFQLQLGDVAKAREVARRALEAINFREEQEKLNVWIALLNLENSFGNEDSAEEIYKEACTYNDGKEISLRFAEILEKSGKEERADEQWKRAIKRFGFSSQVWNEYHRFLLRAGRADDARAMIPRSMQSLEKRKHVKTIVACALNDFRHGDIERGRTIFEGLVDTYPKRLDIWWQYIDQETRSKNTLQVRDLFERILSLKQSSKKVKSVLKKWLDYEKRHGSVEGEQAVLQRARLFVEDRARKTTEQDEAEGSEEE